GDSTGEPLANGPLGTMAGRPWYVAERLWAVGDDGPDSPLPGQDNGQHGIGGVQGPADCGVGWGGSGDSPGEPGKAKVGRTWYWLS
ncbi:MAG: hypothetical protein LBP92_12645, partial [Deltaproteobacteria bacterium]|nr:hypothetical protein [Deltaproteobacteria bacterium]